MMDMITVTAKNLDEAILQASMQLGVSSDRLQYEVIEKGSAGFLGFGAKNAVIKARALSEEEIEKSEKPPSAITSLIFASSSSSCGASGLEAQITVAPTLS